MGIILQGNNGMKRASGDFYCTPTEASRRKQRIVVKYLPAYLPPQAIGSSSIENSSLVGGVALVTGGICAVGAIHRSGRMHSLSVREASRPRTA
jgi:hypothetical protein